MKSLVFGEILWDQFEGYRHIGGAAYNFAAHVAKLGGHSQLISGLGNDELGREALGLVKSCNVGTDFLEVTDNQPTGTVSVLLENGQPSYTIHENTAWDNIVLSESDLASAAGRQWDVLYFGSLAQRSNRNRAALQGLFKSVMFKHVFFDVNIRQHYYSHEILLDSFRRATIVKLNQEEIRLAADLFDLQLADEKAMGNRLAEMFELSVLIITMGKDGAMIFSRGRSSVVASDPVEVADAVGAGDSFSAAFMYAFVHGCDAFEAGRFGTALGSFVASSRGAVPEYSPEIIRLFQSI